MTHISYYQNLLQGYMNQNTLNWCKDRIIDQRNTTDSRNTSSGGGPKDGGRIGQGDHFLPHKFIKRTFESWVNSTKKLLNAGRGHQAPRKAAHCLWKEAGQNIKDKKRDKRVRDGDPSLKEEKFPNTRKPSHQRVCGVFWTLRGQHKREEKINK